MYAISLNQLYSAQTEAETLRSLEAAHEHADMRYA